MSDLGARGGAPARARPTSAAGARRALRRVRRVPRGIARRLLGRSPGTRPLPPWAGPATTRPPIFVGGTGRSGTTITARLLGQHPAYRMVPVEVRFLSDAGGLHDLLEDRITPAQFGRHVMRRWFDRGPGRGLHMITDRETLRAVVRELIDGYPQDRWQAAARFVHRLLDPIAVEAGAQGWIEMTPGTVRVGPTLLRLFPDLRLVHSVRDGRDVACSVVPLFWGPSDLDGALAWWAASLERAYLATERMPADQVVVVRMERLVAGPREAEYARLIAAVGLEDDPTMRAYFEGQVTPENAHIGRWREDVPAGDRPAFEARYAALAAELRQRGLPYGFDEDEPARSGSSA